MLQFIDSHAHLYHDQFDTDRAEMIARAKAVGITKIVLPNIDLTTIEAMESLETAFSELCFAAIGLHPCHAFTDYQEVMQQMEAHLHRRKWIAIGETGIDLYWDKTFIEEQKAAFQIQLDWAKNLDLPIIIHSRESTPECIDQVRKAQDGRLRGVFHCFGGSLEEAKQIIDLGMYLGIGGVATFKKSGLDAVLPAIGLSHVVLETDAPYLAPVPYRGKRNESAYTRLVAEHISELFIQPLSQVARITTANAQNLFRLG
jgi:TatD DNase family protein